MRGPVERDSGMTLVELLVAMTILVTFFAVFSTVAVRIFDSSRSQQARSSNQDTNRLVVQVLDRQVRYANAVNAPTEVDGSTYVDWRSGSRGRQQTCHRWRVDPSGRVQWRSWLVPTSPSGTAAPSPWATVGTGVGRTGTDALFSLATPTATAQVNRQQLTVSFASTHGNPPVDTPTRVTFTALNTRTSSPPASRVCQEVAYG